MLSRNSSSDVIFEQSKPDYEKTLKKNAYKAKLQYIQPTLQQNNCRRRTRTIIWFNPLFSLNEKTNVLSMFLQLIDTHLPEANKLHKIFNRNTVKVIYRCTQTISQITKKIIRKLHR